MMLLLLLLRLACALPFPRIPQQYTATVSINYLDLGYTLAYNEFYDGLSTSGGTLFTEGRFGNIQTFALVDYNARQISEWTYRGDCFSTPFSQLTKPVFGPSIQEFFGADRPDRVFTDLGEIRSQTETRGTLCNKWQEVSATTTTDSTFTTYTNATINYYFAANSSFIARKGRGAVPVRVWSTGTIIKTSLRTGETTTTPFERVTDWVDWTNGAPSAVFQVPSGCVTTNNTALSYDETVPTRSTVVSGGQPTLPSIPTDFRMLVEIKVVEGNVTYDVQTVNWWKDTVHTLERVDVQPEANRDASSLLYIYQSPRLWDGPGYVYNNSGSQCFKLAVYDGAGCASSSCSTARLSYANLNPLVKLRDGGFARLWDNGTWFNGAIYRGRDRARGVDADVWTKYNQRASAQDPTMMYSYTQHVYYFPRGWQWPGRDVSANTTFPLRVINIGTISCLSGSTTCKLVEPISFSDMYDIFQFVPGVPSAASMQEPCPQASCWDGIQNPGEAGVDCGMPACPNPCPVSSGVLPFPKLSKSYITSVSANIINKGYTLSFNEYYDGTVGGNKGALLTEGHFAELSQMELVDYKKNMVYRWTVGGSCIGTSLANVPGGHQGQVGPSFTFFSTAPPNSTYLYYGKIRSVPETRGIECDKWTTTSSQITGDVETNMSISYYFASDRAISNADGPVPVRVWLKGFNTKRGSPPVSFEHVYDWTDWQNVKPPSFIFTPPEPCGTTPNLNLFDETFVITTSQVVPEPLPNSLPVPELPSSLRMVVEAKLNRANSSIEVWSANWWLSGRRERIDLQPVGSKGSSTLYYEYQSDQLWDGQAIYDNVTGFSCYKIAFANLHKCKSSTCTGKTPVTTPNTSSPLLTVRDGAFIRLFGPDKNFFTGGAYVGRKSARGVMADVFMKLQSRTLGATVYNYFQYVYFFPQGWQFPGRAAYNSSVPMRVINEGMMQTGSVTEQFSDVFDIFQFRPGPPPDRVFDARCAEPMSEFDKFVASINNPVGRIIGGIVVTLLLLICIAAIVHCVRKRKRVAAQQAETTKEVELN